MPDISHFVMYIIAALALAFTPGPGMFYVAARTLAGGRREGIASSCGTGLGGMVHVFAGSLGISAVVLASAELFTALKLVGAVYLLWIGFRTFQSASREAANAFLDPSPMSCAGARRAFREGVLVEALNPKTALFFLALIPQFVDLREHVALQFVVLGFVSVALNTLADIAVALAAGSIRAEATARPALIRRLRQGSGAVMMALGCGLALAKLPST